MWYDEEKAKRPQSPRHVEEPVEKVAQFKEGDKVLYMNEKSEHNGKIGTFIGIRPEDGKYRIQFEDGRRLAASPHHVKTISNPLDPYGEENWNK